MQSECDYSQSSVDPKPSRSRKDSPILGGTSLSRPLKENRDDQDGHDVDHFDHRIDRWTGRVLIRIADGITGHGRGVRKGSFAAEIAFLDILLGIIPRSATGSHGDGDE